MRRTSSCVALAILLAACVDTDPTNIATPAKQFDHTTDPYAAAAGVGQYHLAFERGGFETTWKGSGALFNAALTFGTGPGDIHFLNTANGNNDVAFAGLAVRIENNSHGADLYTATVFGDAPNQSLGPKASLGIVTLRETFSFADANNDDYVIVKYSLTNTTNADHNNLQMGYFADVDFNDPSTPAVDETVQNIVSYDPTTQVARVRINGTLTAQHLTGFYNSAVTNYSTVTNGAESNTLTGWFNLFTAGIAGGSLGPSDIRHYLGAAPVTLHAGETKSLIVIMAAGEDAATADANMAAARAKAATIANPTPTKAVAVQIQQLPAAFYATMTFASAAQAASFDAGNTQCAGAPLTVTSVNANKVTASFSSNLIDRTLATGDHVFCAGRLADGTYFTGGSIATMDVPGTTTATRLTTWGGIDRTVSLSPDGNKIVWASNRFAQGTTQTAIYIMGIGGEAVSTPTRLTIGTADVFPAWTPDGQTIVFVSGGGLWKIPATGGTAVAIPGAPIGSGIQDPKVSPDGSKIIFRRTTNSQIWMVPFTGGTMTQLTQPGASNASNLYPEWINSNTFIYANLPPNVADEGIYKVSLNDLAHPTRLTPSEPGVQERFPAMNPSGTVLAFWSGGMIFQDMSSGLHTIMHSNAPMSGAPADANVQFTPDGTKVIYVNTVNNQGNTDIFIAPVPQLRSIQVDNTAPTVTLTNKSGTVGDNGWFVSDVNVDFTAVDAESGVPGLNGCNTVVNTDGLAILLTCVATNGVGLSTTATTTVNRDATAPVITWSGATAYTVDQQVSISCGAADATSGVATTSCPATVSAAAYTFDPSNTRNATAKDKAGNESAKSVTFTVTATVESLSALIQQFVSNQGVANSLIAKLNVGQKAAFINEVQAQAGKKLTQDQADALVRWVDTI